MVICKDIQLLQKNKNEAQLNLFYLFSFKTYKYYLKSERKH